MNAEIFSAEREAEIRAACAGPLGWAYLVGGLREMTMPYSVGLWGAEMIALRAARYIAIYDEVKAEEHHRAE